MQTSHIGKNSHMVYSGSKEANEPVEMTFLGHLSLATVDWKLYFTFKVILYFTLKVILYFTLLFFTLLYWKCYLSLAFGNLLQSSITDGAPVHLFSELCEEIVEIENNFNLKCTLCKPLCAILWKSTNKKKYFLNDASSHGIQENGVHL